MTSTRGTDVLLLARTVRHLRPAQVAHRLRMKTQRAVVPKLPGVLRPFTPGVAAVAGWPPGFQPLDETLARGHPGPEANVRGRFRFLNEERDLGVPPDWTAPGAARLWQYHLSYFEWAWSFLRHSDRAWARSAFAELWRSWQRSASFGRGDHWSPYVTSVRAWVLCGVHALWHGSEREADHVADLARHAAFIRTHLELDVGGNHLLKNLKALCGLGVFLGDDRLVHLATRHLARQIPIQVLADGGHFERSPSYHCQVLGDFMDIRALLEAAGITTVPGLVEAVEAMREWLGAMLMPDGDVPLFNDCALVGRDRLALLGPVPPPERRLSVLSPSGYVVVRPRGGAIHLVADVGPPCPPELPAHAHADCLSFELAVNGERVVVDTGTSTYEYGLRRVFERSTRAHNTVEIDGVDQTEVWGAFRAARLATPQLESATDDKGVVSVSASHDGYERLRGRPRHHRTWRVTGDSVEIVDTVTGRGRHGVTARLHVAGVSDPDDGSHPSVRLGRLSVSRSGPDGTTFGCSPAEVASGFGARKRGVVLTTNYEGTLPAVLRTVLRPHVDVSTGVHVPGEVEVPEGAR